MFILCYNDSTYFLAGTDRNLGSTNQESDPQRGELVIGSAVLLTWKPREGPSANGKEDANNYVTTVQGNDITVREMHTCEELC